MLEHNGHKVSEPSAENTNDKDPVTQLVLSNLFTSFQPSQLFDIVIFNPPYVATDSDELSNAQELKGIEAAWAGGKHGIEVLE